MGRGYLRKHHRSPLPCSSDWWTLVFVFVFLKRIDQVTRNLGDVLSPQDSPVTQANPVQCPAAHGHAVQPADLLPG